MIRISTYNIRNTQDRYNERKDILKSTIHTVGSDLMGLQEVSFEEGGQLDYLVGTSFFQYLGPSQIKFHELNHPDSEAKLDDSQIELKVNQLKSDLIKIKVDRDEILHLSHTRCAQKLIISIKNSKNRLVVINTHLHHTIYDSAIRIHQLQSILDWIQLQNNQLKKNNPFEQQEEIINFLLIGDFNFTPQSKEYSILEANGFISTFAFVNKNEPVITFPTGLTGPHMDVDPPGTFDYIWYKGIGLCAMRSEIFGEQGANGIYASDHMGIFTDFLINDIK